MPVSAFHPAVRDWFNQAFSGPTRVQELAWQEVANGRNTLIAAPTGSGKTLAAFLAVIDQLVKQSEQQLLQDQVYILYVSPLKALSNDIERNLQQPLTGILEQTTTPLQPIRAMVRTGDTTPGEREQMRRKPPHILVTTPESLYLLLTSESGRDMLSQVGTVIVDEIHAIAGGKRGSHLSLSLARLDALNPSKPIRIGLSATQKPIRRIADFLTGNQNCAIVDTGHQRERDIDLVLIGSPLAPVMANEVWEEIYQQLEELIRAHRTTLIFVNTRRLAERAAKHLAERLGEDAVTAHHGSLSRQHRLEAEQSLKQGKLCALVATASLELGIDIGHVDLVCQLGTPNSISAFLQRVGRAGHAINAIPKGRLFPLSRDDLVEAVALQLASQEGRLDSIHIPQAPKDVLAQQLVAEISAREWESDELYQLIIQAYPYQDLERDDFNQVIDMLAEGYATRRGRSSAYIYHDAINGRLRARPAAKLTALMNGGAIPDHFDYDVMLMPQGHLIGNLNEDFAFESLPGDIFQLGNTSYKILKIEQGRVLVEDAKGQPPTIPFWFGDAPGRSDELSQAVSELRTSLDKKLDNSDQEACALWLTAQGIMPIAAQQLVAYLHAARLALGCIPSQRHIVLERFFDDTGDMHLVIHAPFGSRLMRAWGLALRKRFCRHFNFELQASALEDSLILSLGETHSFDLEEVMSYLQPATVRDVLIQALLDAPMFEARWRWNATIALAVQRMRNGKKLPPQWQRNQAEDLIAVIFPDQLACLENIQGAREIPDHPLVTQTIDDCLHDTMDIEGLEHVLASIEAGDIQYSAFDLTGPSPLSQEVISAKPYAFLDDGDAENRRTRAISHNPKDLEQAGSLKTLSVDAITQVQQEIWIRPRNRDELHDGLMQLGFLTHSEFSSGATGSGIQSDQAQWPEFFKSLQEEHRAALVRVGEQRYWVASERLAEFQTAYPDCQAQPNCPWSGGRTVIEDADLALTELLRSRLTGLGPVNLEQLCIDFSLPEGDIQAALERLRQQGYVISLADNDTRQRWCERRLLARIHRYSREQRRKSVQTVSPATYMRFLLRWHSLDQPQQSIDTALEQLEGWAAPLSTWEHELLPARTDQYSAMEMDQRFLSGQLGWLRVANKGQQIIAATPILIGHRERLDIWQPISEEPELGPRAQRLLEILQQQGALFARDLEVHSGFLRPELETALCELIAKGVISADAISPLRWLLRPEQQKHKVLKAARRRSTQLPGQQLLGRWSVIPANTEPSSATFRSRQVAAVCQALLKRYGVVFRAVVEREPQLPPWRELLYYLRRMEDRGEVRGGRFVDGFSGEQFALAEAIQPLRQAESSQLGMLVISAADPLNLGGILLPGPKTSTHMGNRILLDNGLPAARLVSGKVEYLPGCSQSCKQSAESLLSIVRPSRRIHKI